MKTLLLFCGVLFLASSCVTTDKCSAKINKKKFDYYNKLQYGADKPIVKKRGR